MQSEIIESICDENECSTSNALKLYFYRLVQYD